MSFREVLECPAWPLNSCVMLCPVCCAASAFVASDAVFLPKMCLNWLSSPALNLDVSTGALNCFSMRVYTVHVACKWVLCWRVALNLDIECNGLGGSRDGAWMSLACACILFHYSCYAPANKCEKCWKRLALARPRGEPTMIVIACYCFWNAN